jgi:hypothetical protein
MRSSLRFQICMSQAHGGVGRRSPNRSSSLRILICLSIVFGVGELPPAEADDPNGEPAADVVRFTRLQLTERYYCDGITSGDINGDGHSDIVAGPFWYEGPSLEKAHEFYEASVIPREPSPSNSMFSFVYDFNGDQRPDILVLGRVHLHPATWYENPGNTDGLWQAHFAFERVRGESPLLCNLVDNGIPQLICHWDGCWGFIQPDPKHATAPWTFTAIGENEDWPQFYHGQGVADVNRDSRPDVLLNDGWYEQPEQILPGRLWPFHRGKFSTERGGAQMFADDVDGDGDQDIITALHAHEWGLAWFEKLQGQENADPTGSDRRSVGGDVFRQHMIMHDHSREQELGAAFSQPHALALADIDGDGHNDIVTGKRMWAHGPNGDIEPNAPPVLYWFQWTKDDVGNVRFVPYMIDDNSGVGVQVTVADVNADARPDILTVSKLGTFVFLNEKP